MNKGIAFTGRFIHSVSLELAIIINDNKFCKLTMIGLKLLADMIINFSLNYHCHTSVYIHNYMSKCQLNKNQADKYVYVDESGYSGQAWIRGEEPFIFKVGS